MSALTVSTDRRTFLRGVGSAGLLLSFAGTAAACGSEKPSDAALSMLSFADYNAPENLKKFNVTVTPFDSPSEGLTKVRAPGASYDVMLLDGTVVQGALAGNLLAALPRDRMPNLANLTPAGRRQPWDPSGTYTVIKDFAPVGWGYAKKAFLPGGTGAKWSDFFAAVQGPASKKFVLYPDGSAMAYAYFLANGIETGKATTADIAAAQNFWVTKIASHILDMPAQPQLAVQDGSAVLAMIGSGDLRASLSSMPDPDSWGFELGQPHGMTYVDIWGILAQSKNKDRAAEFINFMLSPEAASQELATLGYPVPIMGVTLPPDLVRPDLINLPPAELEAAVPVLPDAYADQYAALLQAVQTAAA